MKTWMLLCAVTMSLGLFGCPDKDSAAADPAVAAKDAAAAVPAAVAPPGAKPATPPAAKASGGW